jgi:ubiquitin thioesterase protein OTUB1
LGVFDKPKIQMTQAEIDEMQKNIELSENKINQLKEEIEKNSPYISDLVDLGVLKEEYRDNKFENCFDDLYKRFTKVRRLRRDGNCFYRAFLFQFFEYFIHNKESALYASFLANIEKSKKELMDQGYDEMAIEDFYDLFLTEVKKLKTVKIENAAEHLLALLGNKEEATYLVMYSRFLTSLYLKQNVVLYEDFIGGDIAVFCVQEVEQVDAECDHI